MWLAECVNCAPFHIHLCPEPSTGGNTRVWCSPRPGWRCPLKSQSSHSRPGYCSGDTVGHVRFLIVHRSQSGRNRLKDLQLKPTALVHDVTDLSLWEKVNIQRGRNVNKVGCIILTMLKWDLNFIESVFAVQYLLIDYSILMLNCIFYFCPCYNFKEKFKKFNHFKYVSSTLNKNQTISVCKWN